MNTSRKRIAVLIMTGVVTAWPVMAADAPSMSFFVTSKGSGNGADLGGLAGADALCNQLAKAAGAGSKTWVAYLSTQGPGAINAKDRIGTGPWYNAKGTLIAKDMASLHDPSVNINHETALDETGQLVPSVKVGADGKALPRDQQGGVEHDILTGTQPDGTAFGAGDDRTCKNWTSSSEGTAMLGHHDRRSLQPGVSPWSTAHPSQGCSQEKLVASGGSGRFYCFAK